MRLLVVTPETYYLIFQSTHPMRGATRPCPACLLLSQDFNPRTPCGVRHCKHHHHPLFTDISIHAPHAGCDSTAHKLELRAIRISIHAPHAGCDPLTRRGHEGTDKISIHAPHAGCDKACGGGSSSYPLFQSTHPMRGATGVRPLSIARSMNFNPRTPCGVRPQAGRL